MLNVACSEERAKEEKAQLKAHNSTLAGVLEHFETIAEEVDVKADHQEDNYLRATAGRLRYNVRNLRQVKIPPSPMCIFIYMHAAVKSLLVEFGGHVWHGITGINSPACSV